MANRGRRGDAQRNSGSLSARRRLSRGPTWKNRIVDHGVEAPDQLLANPHNWRGHPIGQQNAVGELLEKLGWVQRVVVNRRTGHVVDGHLRIELALRHDEEAVPVTYIDVSEEEERLVLASLDPTSAMAFPDREKLDELIGSLPDELAGLARALHQDKRAVRKLVTFEAAQHFRVVVECASEADQRALAERLVAEGYDCRIE